jgi:hypothetical protein
VSNKSTYRHFYTEDIHPIFHHPDWLDAVCGDSWDVALSYDKDKKINGALPFFIEKKTGFHLLRQPHLTPYLGPIIKYPKRQEKLSYRYGYDKIVIDELLTSLPEFSYFNQKCHLDFTNGQPFYWQDFELYTNYTFRINLKQPYQDIESEFEGKVRTDIRKADRELTVYESDDIEAFYKLNQKPFLQQQIDVPYNLEIVKHLDSFLAGKKKRTILIVKDKADQWHAAAYIVLDKSTAYTLMIASDPMLRKSGAIAFLISRLIIQLKDLYKSLDFCGSMEERFQRVFRSFGAEQCPYLRVSKKNGATFKTLNALTGKGS